MTNQIGLDGIEFIEVSNPNQQEILNVLYDFGFSLTGEIPGKKIAYCKQNQIKVLVNSEERSFGFKFSESHGPSISSMGWRFKDAKVAHALAISRGAKNCTEGDYPVPAIYGIGESIIYFFQTTQQPNDLEVLGVRPASKPVLKPGKGFLYIDHLTNNVYKGTMADWSNFYKNIFEFTEVRYFDIKGQKTGLTSFALKSADGSFCIPINEATDKKSQINEYLEEYKGPGVQHLAFCTENIIGSIKGLQGTSVKLMDIDPNYYKTVWNRVPNVQEDKNALRDLNILVDGDPEGYLLQIFTKNIWGPIFIEVIQRHNHHSFGEGNFQALFDSIERDQMKRGYLE